MINMLARSILKENMLFEFNSIQLANKVEPFLRLSKKKERKKDEKHSEKDLFNCVSFCEFL